MKIASLLSLAYGLILVIATVAHGAEEIVNSLGMKLVRIESGEFIMGAGEARPRRARNGTAAIGMSRRLTKSK